MSNQLPASEARDDAGVTSAGVREWSQDQNRFFNWVETGSGSAVLLAAAGSGKTTTIVEAARRLPPNLLVRFLAFNKNIATELQGRLPSHVQCSTFHSVGLATLTRSLPKQPKIDGDKVRTLLKSNLDWKDFEVYGTYCCRLVSYAKAAGLGTVLAPDELSEWDRLVSHFCLTLDSPDSDPARALAIARSAFADSASDLTSLDFDDMLYLALRRNVVFDRCNFLFVDEAQDTNGVQRALLHRMLAGDNFHTGGSTYDTGRVNPGSTQTVDVQPGKPLASVVGRLIAVGDPHQAIYGFRGADADSIGALTREFSCVEMPLSVSYRCSRAVVAEAQRVLAQSL